MARRDQDRGSHCQGAKPRSVPDGAYAAVTFLSDEATTNGKIGEALYESATDGNNFFSFSEINSGNPVIVSNTDTKGLRDPYVLKSKVATSST